MACLILLGDVEFGIIQKSVPITVKFTNPIPVKFIGIHLLNIPSKRIYCTTWTISGAFLPKAGIPKHRNRLHLSPIASLGAGV